MMRVIFLLLLSSIAFQSNSQTWNNYLQKRFKSYGIWADSILLVPNDTSLNKTGFAIKGSTAYIGDGVKWTAITGGSSVVDSLVYATKANVIKVRDSLLAADNFWSGENRFSNILKVDNQIKVGLESGTTGSIKFYNQVHTNTATIFASDTLATDVDIELPTSSGKLALTTDIAIVDTSIISTKAYVNYKDDIQQGFIDMRKLESDSSADNGYTSRGRLQQQLDSARAAQQAMIHDTINNLNRLKAGTSAGVQLLSNSGATVAEFGLDRGTNFDFHGFAGYDANRSASYTDRSFTDKKYVDSTVALKLNISDTSVFARKAILINNQVASYTLVLADAGARVRINSASATTLTVPPNSSVAFPIGTQILIKRVGSGDYVTITAGSGVTFSNADSALRLRVAGSSCVLTKTGTDTWDLEGDLI